MMANTSIPKLSVPIPAKFVKIRYMLVIAFIIFQSIFLIALHKRGNSYFQTNLKVFDRSQSSLTYKNLLKSFNPQDFIRKPLKERCDAYFDQIYKIDQNWKIPDLKGMDFSLDVFDKNGFFKRRYNDLKKELEKQGKPTTDIDTSGIFKELSAKIAMNDKIQETLQDNAGHLRIYGKCYTDNSNYNHPNCLDIEGRLFPFLTFEPPISTRWDGTVVNDWLDISKYYQWDESELSSTSGYKDRFDEQGENCNLRIFKDKMKGRGIVISVGDQFIDEIVNLLKVLRYQGNQLPIEFVHKGDLAQKSKDRIVEAARETIYIPKMDLTINTSPQEVWFIDANRCFVQDYYYNFSHFANKWVAVMFNTFEDMFLMDSDAVAFVKPNEFFDLLTDYKRTKAYFFKDRETAEQFPTEYKNIFVKMLPTEIENAFFDIPATTEHTLETKFMRNNARHFMESGIVLMNRKQHIIGILMAVHIQFWGPLNTFIYGEKEIFWLGQSIAGDESYTFNPHAAGAVGVIQKTDTDHHIIGANPAHIAPDGKSLLWVNSGMETCKKHTWEADFQNVNSMKERFQSEEEVKNFYLSPLQIEGAIIPPDATKDFSNKENRPTRGWANRRELGCNGYYWIAHSTVGANPDDASSIGKEIEFTPEQKSIYNRISQIWVYAHEFKKEETISPAAEADASANAPAVAGAVAAAN